jgi:hypothetical protein
MKKISAVLIALFILSGNAFAGGSVSGKIRAINTDTRPAHSVNHSYMFVMFEGSTDRYYLKLDSNDQTATYNSSLLLSAQMSGQEVHIQWENIAISSSFDRKITFIAIGNDWPWPAQ